MNEETTTTETEERVPRPEEVLEDAEEHAREGVPTPSAMKCTAGSREDGGCPRDATTWLIPEGRTMPMCDEHYRVNKIGMEYSHWEMALYAVEDWLKMARAWGHPDLEQKALNVLEDVKEEYIKAQARRDLADEIADAPRKGRDERITDLTPEQDERLRRVMCNCSNQKVCEVA